MTLIAAIKTRQGIVMTADSKEMVQGGQLLWTDFETILRSKSLDENSDHPAISPSELTELFRATAQANEGGRIKSTDTGLKLFKLTQYLGLSTTGTANPGGFEFTEVIKNIQSKLDTTQNSFDQVCNIAFTYFEEIFEKDGMNKINNTIIFCGFDESEDRFRMLTFFYHYNFIPDGNNGMKRDEQGQFLKDYFFHKVECGDGQPLLLKGWIGCLQSLESYNQKAPDISLIQGFTLLKKIMELGVTIEEISHTVTGIGGKILYAIITENGFRFVESEAEVRNLL